MENDSINIVSDDSLDDSVVAEEHTGEMIKKLREKLKICEKEKLEYLTGWQRAKADLINARKRDDDDRKEFIRFANEGLLNDILPVLESWDSAMNHKESWEKGDPSWRQGMESIINQLKGVLSNNGLAEINPLGEKFDHSKHESVSHKIVDDAKLDQMILDVVQKGYSLGDKILKPAKVVVAEYRAVV
ncbi:MAG: nucleotide exchange factor GrpE [Candidatus Paceibacterota bacterium]